MYVVSPIMGNYTEFYIDKFSSVVGSEIRTNLFKSILNQNYETKLDDTVFTSILEDVKIISTTSIKPKALLIKAGINFVLGLYFVSQINSLIIIIILFTGLLAAVINKTLNKKYENAIEKSRISNDKIWDMFLFIEKFFVDIKLNSRSLFYIQKAKIIGDDVRETEIEENKRHKIMNALDGILFMITIGLLYIVCSIFVYYDMMTMGGLVAIMMYNSILVDPLMDISNFIREQSKLNVSLRRLDKYNFNEEILESYELVTDFNEFQISNICFERSDKKVLHDINLSMKKGDKIAIVGLSGSGKSSFGKILCGLVNATSGEIRLDDMVIDNLEILRNVSSVLTEECNFVETNLRDNLDLAIDNFSENELSSLLELFKLETVVSDENDFKNLSGGEQKRLGILRTLIKPANVYILDEMSNNLDNNLTHLIIDYIFNNTGDKIIIAIDHRIDIIKKFPKIVFFENGEIIAMGTHDELYDKCISYRKLTEKGVIE